MKLKLRDVAKNYLSLMKFSNLNLSELGFTYKQAKSIIIMVKKLREEIEILERMREEIGLKIGLEKDPFNQQAFQIDTKKPELLKKFQEEDDKLLENEIEVEYEKILIDLTKNRKLDLSTNDIINLEVFFNFEEE